MGYRFHITRADFWYNSESAPIARTEWEAVAAAHPELREEGPMVWRDIGPQRQFAIPGESAGFSWRSGRIDIEGPFLDSTRRVALELSDVLGARLQGDDD